MRFQKLLSIVLAVLLIAAVTPLGAFVVSADTEGYYTYMISDDLQATITSVNTSISGNITIPSTLGGYPIRSIGNNAFEGCKDIATLIIPNGIKRIGHDAFKDCTGITSVSIPNSISSINNNTFYNCTSINTVSIPEGVTSIGRGAFHGCAGLTDMIIPDSVISIGEYAFSGCKSLTSITIPDGVTSIGEYAFSGCESLTSITIPNSVKSIGFYALYCCYSLEEITLPFVGGKRYTPTDTNQYPLGYIFGNWHGGGGVLITQTYCASVTSIGASTYSDATYYYPLSLKSVTITDCEYIQYGAFSDFYTLTNITIGNSVTTIGDSAFCGCKGLASITIPDSVTSIGKSAFESCTGLKSITIPDSVTSIGDEAFYGCTGLTSVTIGNGVTSIGNHAFYGCAEIKSATIGKSVESIGCWAFTECTGITSIAIPDSVKIIDYGAFCGCIALTDVEIGTGVSSIGKEAFKSCLALKRIIIPNNVTDIGVYAFSKCISLEEITLPYVGNRRYDSTATELMHFGNIFDECNCISNIRSDGENYYHASFGGGKDFHIPTALKKITITDCDYIPYCSFYGCKYIESIILNEGVSIIGEQAFYGCDMLTKISIPNSIANIGNGAFWNCSNLVFNNNDNDEYLGNKSNPYLVLYKVDPSSSRTEYSISPKTKIIKYNAFYNCSQITSVAISNSVISIGDSAFKSCDNLNTVYYCGSDQEWNKIDIASNNDYLNSATRKYHKPTNLEGEDYEKDSDNHWKVCEICGEILNFNPHLFDNDCDTTCNVCGYTRTITHSYSNVWTCDGRYHWHECSICGNKKDLCECNYNSIVSDEFVKTTADCTHRAVYYQSCSVCGAKSVETFEYGEKLGHIFVRTIATAYRKSSADCIHKAVYYKSCSLCGAKSTETFEYGEKLGHNYISEITAPTCVANGFTTHTCSRCGDSYADTYTGMTAHTYVNSVDSKYFISAADCTHPALYYKSCSLCGAKSNETFESGTALGHNLTHHNAKAPTCTEKGWDAYDTCSRCDYTTYNERAALGHDLIHHDAKAPTCTSKGWDAYDTCSRCDYTTYHELNATGHTPATAVTENTHAATCTVNGSYDEVVYCSTCGVELSREEKTILSEGHKYSESWTSDATNHWHVCTVCGDKKDLAKHSFVNGKCSVCGYIAVKVSFPDVNLKDWYGDAVSYAVSAGLMKGYGSGKFGTADGIQRQDFVVILSRLSGDDLSKYEGKSSFKDVPTNAYYATALAWAKAVGVSSGYANGKFGVGDKVTREQIVTFLYNYAKRKGYNTKVTDQQKAAIRAQYSDFKTVSSYAQEAAYWALSRGVISGKNTGGKKLIAPKANALRCEVAAMFYNIDQNNIFA